MTIRKGMNLKRKLSTRSSSVSSGERIAAKKKRVSFSALLNQTRIIGELNPNKVATPESKPSKGILKLRTKKLKSDPEAGENERPSDKKSAFHVLKKELPFSAFEQQYKPDFGEKKKSTAKAGLMKTNENRKGKGRQQRQRVQRKSKITLKLHKSTKETLMSLNKKDRREFIRQLQEKNKPHYELTKKSTKLWEVIRSSKTPKEKREEKIQQLMALCEGQLTKLIYSPITCRVIQCLLALKRPHIRELLFDELKPEIVRMIKSPYAKFFIAKMLKYGTKEQRDIVINALNGHCVRLYQISHASRILEDVYNEWATADQRHSIIAEFYGPEFTLYKNDQNIAPSHLKIEAIARCHPEKMPTVLNSLEVILQKALLKVQTLKLSLTHKLLLDFLTYCTQSQREAVIDSIKDQLPEICHTQEGSRAALNCIWNANEKERKTIVKSFTGFAVKTCQDQYARRALFAIFDTVDDTALVNKIFTEQIANNIADLVYHQYGVWTLHYLVHPRDRRVIGKGLYEMLKEGDSKNKYCGKEPSQRYLELFECVRESLLTFMRANMREMITNKCSAVLVLDTLEPNSPSSPFERELSDEDVQECFRAIAEVASDEFIPNSVDGPSHIVQGGCARFVFRRLLQADPQQKEGRKLSDFLADLPAECLRSWTGMDCGYYTLLEMHKSGSNRAKKALRSALSQNALQSSRFAGAKKLLDEMKGVTVHAVGAEKKIKKENSEDSPVKLKKVKREKGNC